MNLSWNLLVALAFLETAAWDFYDLKLSAGTNWSWNLLVTFTILGTVA